MTSQACSEARQAFRGWILEACARLTVGGVAIGICLTRKWVSLTFRKGLLFRLTARVLADSENDQNYVGVIVKVSEVIAMIVFHAGNRGIFGVGLHRNVDGFIRMIQARIDYAEVAGTSRFPRFQKFRQ